MNNQKTLLVAGAIFLAAASRLVPHPANFTPLGAMALFGAAYFDRKIFTYLVPAIALYLSNLVIDNVLYTQEGFLWMAPAFPWQVAGFSLIALMGSFTLKNPKLSHVFASSLGASAIFFVVSNLGQWIGSDLYTKDWQGFVLCYEAAIPFFGNTIAGDLCYSALLFGGYALLKQRVPALAHA